MFAIKLFIISLFGKKMMRVVTWNWQRIWMVTHFWILPRYKNPEPRQKLIAQKVFPLCHTQRSC
ncbi:hypothetical protein BJN42_20735 [Pseudomonas koreensis]|nr:hypothetical protein BJN42_20735 [Pseudomonas koreensis]